MTRHHISLIGFLLLGGASGFALSGCSGPPGPESPKPVSTVAPSGEAANAPATNAPAAAEGTAESEDHGHKPGEHGGILVSLGRDSYHVEAVFEAGGTLRLYTLGKDESRVVDVESQSLKGFVKPLGGQDATPVAFAPQPQEGDAAGRTSQFVGTLPAEFVGRPVTVTIPNIVISGERFRLGFESSIAARGETMPGKVADGEERALYLTPGGLYTQADIEANGGGTALEKFRGLMSSHDMQPKVGDRICPITSTKANARFTWVVAGKPYEFCCPPCVDEFVKTAKTAPDSIKEPKEYVQR